MTVTGIGQPYITHYPDYAVANNKLLTLANSLAPISYLVCYQGFRANVEQHEPGIKSGQGCPRGDNMVNSKSGFNCTIIYVKLWVYKEYLVFTE